jgi:hypothetical protein
MAQLRSGETRDPNPGIETALAEAMAGRLDMREFLFQFGDAGIIVPSGVDFSADPTVFSPMMFSPDDVPLMAVFTARDRANAWRAEAPHSTTMTGLTVFERLPSGVGIVVNPGFGLGFEMQPDGVPAILAELTAAGAPSPSVRLEQSILDARSGDTSAELLLGTFAASRIYSLSTTDDGLSPISFLRDGSPDLVGVFTRPAFAEQYAEGIDHVGYVETRELVAALESGVGIVVNPGTPHPWEISADIVAELGSAA